MPVVTFLPAALPVPGATGGVGAAVDVRSLGGNMTFNLDASDGDVVVVEGSDDGVTRWGEFVKLSNERTTQQPEDAVVGFIRLRRQRVDPTPGGGPVAPVVSMAAQPLPTGYAYSTIPVVIPAGDGSGAAVDVRSIGLTNEVKKGPAKALVCSTFDAGDKLVLEASTDGNAPWSTVMELQQGRILSVTGSLAFVRVTRSRVPAAGPRVGVDGATCAFMGQTVAPSAAVNAGSFGANEAAIAAAIAAAPAGGTVLIPDGAWAITAGIVIAKSLELQLSRGCVLNCSAAACITIQGCSDVRIVGGTINLLATGASQYAFNPSGVVSNLFIERVTVNGTANAADQQQGFGNVSGQTLTNIDIIGCIFSSLMIGISLNADLGGAITDVLLENNRVVGSVGTNSGQGYGIHHANGSGNPSMLRIIGNYVENCQRHGIYQARGRGVTIADNHIRNHRSTVSGGLQRPALSIGRSSDVTVQGNVFEDCYDCCIDVFTDAAGLVSNNVTITGNVFRNWRAFFAITVGTSAPDTGGFPTDVVIAGNSFYQDLAVTGSSGSDAACALFLLAGKRVTWAHNVMVMVSATAATNMMRLAATLEGAGTATYTDDIRFIANQVFADTANPRWCRFDALMCAAGCRLEFLQNRLNLATSFSRPAALTNTNIYTFHTPVDGLDGSVLHSLDNLPAGAPRMGVSGEIWTDLVYATPIAVDASLGRSYNITANNGVAFTISTPTNAWKAGQHIDITVRNTSGGALGAVTWGAGYKMSAWVSPATGNSRTITFKYDGANWIEVARTAADVPN